MKGKKMRVAEELGLKSYFETNALIVLCCVLDSQPCWSYDYLYQMERVLGGFRISSRGHSPAEANLCHQNKRKSNLYSKQPLTVVFVAKTIASPYSRGPLRADEPQVAHTVSVGSDAIATSSAGSGYRWYGGYTTRFSYSLAKHAGHMTHPALAAPLQDGPNRRQSVLKRWRWTVHTRRSRRCDTKHHRKC